MNLQRIFICSLIGHDITESEEDRCYEKSELGHIAVESNCKRCNSKLIFKAQPDNEYLLIDDDSNV